MISTITFYFDSTFSVIAYPLKWNKLTIVLTLADVNTVIMWICVVINDKRGWQSVDSDKFVAYS